MNRFFLDRWSHHHTHRLAHLAFAICYSFAAVAVSGLVFVSHNQQVAALTITEQDSVSITATVADVSPGPVVVPGSGGGGQLPPVLPPTPLPSATLTVNPEPLGKIPEQQISIGGKTETVFVFPTVRPQFSGQTSIPGALIYLQFLGDHPFISTTYANSRGEWFWQAPGDLTDSLYTLVVTAQDPRYPQIKVTKSLRFIITVPATDQPATPDQSAKPPVFIPPVGDSSLINSDSAGTGNNSNFGIGQFSIFVGLEGKYQAINPGQNLVATIRLIDNRQIFEQRKQLIRYTISGPDGKSILEAVDELLFNRDLTFQKTFQINPAARLGSYRLTVRAESVGDQTLASTEFQVRPLPSQLLEDKTSFPAPVYFLPDSFWYLLTALFGIFILVAVAAFYKVYALSALIGTTIPAVKPRQEQENNKEV